MRPHGSSASLFRELYELIDAGELPAYKVGRNIKLRQADVDAFRRRDSSG